MPQPHTPTPFWRVFESFPAQSSATLEWRQWLGNDYTRFVSLLKTTGETAGTVLIQYQPHRVIVHARDRAVAVPEEGGPAIPLDAGDAQIRRLDMRALRDRLAAAFNIEQPAVPLSRHEPGRNLGRWTVCPERSVMTHLVLECDHDARSNAVRRLLTDYEGPLLILTPTRIYDAELHVALRARTACCVGLEEAILVDDKGRFTLCPEAEAELERFRARVVALEHASEDSSEYRMVREGSVWLIVFGQHRCQIPHSQASGLAYIQHMLARPGKVITVVDLEKSVVGNARADAVSIGEDVLDREGVRKLEDDFRRLTRERERAIANGDIAGETSAQSDLKALASQLRAGRGLHGSFRRTGDDIERVRSRVSKSLTRARQKLRAAGSPLDAHLDALSVGRMLIYIPSPALEWQFY